MDPTTRKKLCKFYISSESAEMVADMELALNSFANGHQTSAELLAQAINAFDADARIPEQ